MVKPFLMPEGHYKDTLRQQNKLFLNTEPILLAESSLIRFLWADHQPMTKLEIIHGNTSHK